MDYDIIIIGAGPAGYVAAIRSAQVGLKTAIIEKKYIGGMCLNWGCIPTKSLIESARVFDKVKNSEEYGVDGIDKSSLSFNWSIAKERANKITNRLTSGINYLLAKNDVKIIYGKAKIISNNSVTVENRNIKSKHIIIATGSYPDKLVFNKPDRSIIDIEHLFELDKLPQHLAVIGGGGVALEMAQFFNMIGKDVTFVSNQEVILPDIDDYLNKYIVKKLSHPGIVIIENGTIESYEKGYLTIHNKKYKADKIINCNWRKAVIPKSDITIDTNEKGYIKTNSSLETSVKGIYAIGDVNGISYTAHSASAQGIGVINHIKGIDFKYDLDAIPLNIYTTPEMAQIGKTEKTLKESGIDYKVSQFPLSANGKALIEGNTDGLIRLLSDNKYGKVLGVQIIASNATDMISEAAAFMHLDATVYDIAQTIHAHPTVSEIFIESGFDAMDKAIHK